MPVDAEVTASTICTKNSPDVEADAVFLLLSFLSVSGGTLGGVSMLSCTSLSTRKVVNIDTNIQSIY